MAILSPSKRSFSSVSSDETLTISVSPNKNYITEKVMANNKELQINADEKYDLVLKDFEESNITISATFTIDNNKEFNLPIRSVVIEKRRNHF